MTDTKEAHLQLVLTRARTHLCACTVSAFSVSLGGDWETSKSFGLPPRYCTQSDPEAS